MVGMVVVRGNEVLGVDIFGHPDLFKRQYNSLLHGYVAEAGSGDTQAGDAAANSAFTKVARLAASTAVGTDEVGKFSRFGSWVHLYSK